MPSIYISNREKALNFFKVKVLPMIKEKDLDENKLIAWMTTTTATSPKLIKEILENHIIMGVIKRCEGGCLTISDTELDEILKEQKSIRDIEKEADDILI